MHSKKSWWRGVGLFAGTAALLVTGMAGAYSAPGGTPGPGGGRGGGGGGGGPGEETVTNSLSVPTIMVGGGFTGVLCGTAETPSTLVPPTGDPSTGYPLDATAYYYVQGVNKWQAQCYTADAASAFAAWGDNLTGDAALKTGSPIRVELGLNNTGTSPDMQGYTVLKLEPSALDRESAYGILATGSPDTGFSAPPVTFTSTQQLVYDAGTTFSILNNDTGQYVVPAGTNPTAEINATGKVVYGYNLRVTAAGSYTIVFTIPTVSITGSDAPAGQGGYTEHTVTLNITVTGGRGGGGGGGGPRR